MRAARVPDDGRNLLAELAEAIAVHSEGNAALIVMAGKIVAKLSRQEQLCFLAGDMKVLGPKK